MPMLGVHNSVIFCGAGISLHSGIPLVSQITESVFESLSVSSEHVNEFKTTNLPFEAFMEVLFTHTDATPLLELFNSKNPGRNHKFFAQLAKSGLVSVFVTTNFDTLIEQAFQEVNVPFQLYYTNEDLKTVDFNDNTVRLIKLHGCVSDAETLAVTIRNVANQRVVAGRNKLLRTLFTHPKFNLTIVLGYSRSDRFDINPSIENAANPTHKIFLIDHCVDLTKSAYALTLRGNREFPPFSGYDGSVIRCDTDELISALWTKLLDDPIPQQCNCKMPWKDWIRSWIARTIDTRTLGIVPLISALLFKATNLYAISNHYAKEALGLGSISKDGDFMALALQTLGDNHRDLGEFDAAANYLEKALHEAKSKGLRKREAWAELSLGIVFEDQAKSEINSSKRRLAISHYERALRLAQEIGDLELEGKCEGNLGIIYKNLETLDSLRLATSHHKRALRLARKIGDKRSEGRTYGNLGTTFAVREQKNVAFRCYERAESIARDLGDIRHIGIWTANAGEDYIGIDSGKAATHLERAIAIFKSLGLWHYVSYCQNLLNKLRDRDSDNEA